MGNTAESHEIRFVIAKADALSKEKGFNYFGNIISIFQLKIKSDCLSLSLSLFHVSTVTEPIYQQGSNPTDSFGMFS